MPDPVKTRRYTSAVRAEQAAATRGAVLTAARELFTTSGYAGTTVAQVARLAGVSVDTVYTSVGRRPELLLAVHDMALGGGDEPVTAEQRDYVAAIREARGARCKLEAYAAALGERLPAVVPLAESLRFATELRSTGELRPDLTDADVAHLLWTMNSPSFYRLATSGGRGPADYAALVLDLWTHALLA